MKDLVRVCLKVRPAGLSRSIHRIAAALKEHAPPWVLVVPRDRDADVVIHHVIGMTGWPEQLAADTAAGRQYVIAQYCLRSTEAPTPRAWLPLWQNAAMVWTYYDLFQFLGEDPATAFLGGTFTAFTSPLGVDPSTFFPQPGIQKQFRIGTSGYVAETEGVREAHDAAVRSGGRHFHLGPILPYTHHTTQAHGITDDELRTFWTACDHVAGLRRVEGFELPALEGLACGARPICFDAPHYRNWYGEHAEYIPEAGPAEVECALYDIFARGPRVVTEAERAHVVDVFAWSRIVADFWATLESNVR